MSHICIAPSLLKSFGYHKGLNIAIKDLECSSLYSVEHESMVFLMLMTHLQGKISGDSLKFRLLNITIYGFINGFRYTS
jgi:hypothetical protein